MKYRVSENELWPAYSLSRVPDGDDADHDHIIDVDEEFVERWKRAADLFYSMQDEILRKIYGRQREIEEEAWSPEFKLQRQLMHGPIEFEGHKIISMRQAIDEKSHYLEVGAAIFAIHKDQPGIFIIKETHSKSCLIEFKGRVLGWCPFNRILGFPEKTIVHYGINQGHTPACGEGNFCSQKPLGVNQVWCEKCREVLKKCHGGNDFLDNLQNGFPQ